MERAHIARADQRARLRSQGAPNGASAPDSFERPLLRVFVRPIVESACLQGFTYNALYLCEIADLNGDTVAAI